MAQPTKLLVSTYRTDRCVQLRERWLLKTLGQPFSVTSRPPEMQAQLCWSKYLERHSSLFIGVFIIVNHVQVRVSLPPSTLRSVLTPPQDLAAVKLDRCLSLMTQAMHASGDHPRSLVSFHILLGWKGSCTGVCFQLSPALLEALAEPCVARRWIK